MRVLVLIAIAIVCAAAGLARADDATDGAAFAAAAPHCVRSRPHCFALQLHVARNEDGTPVVEPTWFAAQLAMANKQFEPIDASFQIASVDFLASDAAKIEDRQERASLAKLLNPRVIDVFLTGYLADIDKPGSFVYGVTWHTKDERKFIIISGMGRDRTLAHELGHFFGLPHSTYAISIMNKAPRDLPAPEDRRFADEEIAKIKPALVRLVKDKVIAEATPLPDQLPAGRNDIP